jgi:hypothetical protein
MDRVPNRSYHIYPYTRNLLAEGSEDRHGPGILLPSSAGLQLQEGFHQHLNTEAHPRRCPDSTEQLQESERR